MTKKLTPAAVLLLVPLVAPAVHAQPEMVPLEVVQALLPGYFPDDTTPDVRVGELPPEVAAVLTLPAGARVVGSLVFERQSQSAVAVAGESDAALRLVEQQLLADGWRRALRMHERGFASRASAESATFCRGRETVTLHVHCGSVATYLRIWHATGAEYSPCDEGRRAAAPLGLEPIPTLLPPAGAIVRGSGSSGGGDHTSAYASVRTDATPGSLLRHYAEQLREHGWDAGPEHSGPQVAVQTWRVTDPEGDVWHGILLAASHPEPGRSDLMLRLVRTDPQR